MFNKKLVNLVKFISTEIWNNSTNKLALAIKAIHKNNVIIFVVDNYLVASELKIFFEATFNSNTKINQTQTGILYQEYHVNLYLNKTNFDNINRIIHKNMNFFPNGIGCESYVVYSGDITHSNIKKFTHLINSVSDESETLIDQKILLDYEF